MMPDVYIKYKYTVQSIVHTVYVLSLATILYFYFTGRIF
jgi:hypothetical protein